MNYLFVNICCIKFAALIITFFPSNITMTTTLFFYSTPQIISTLNITALFHFIVLYNRFCKSLFRVNQMMRRRSDNSFSLYNACTRLRFFLFQKISKEIRLYYHISRTYRHIMAYYLAIHKNKKTAITNIKNDINIPPHVPRAQQLLRSWFHAFPCAALQRTKTTSSGVTHIQHIFVPCLNILF